MAGWSRGQAFTYGCERQETGKNGPWSGLDKPPHKTDIALALESRVCGITHSPAGVIPADISPHLEGRYKIYGPAQKFAQAPIRARRFSSAVRLRYEKFGGVTGCMGQSQFACLVSEVGFVTGPISERRPQSMNRCVNAHRLGQVFVHGLAGDRPLAAASWPHIAFWVG